MVAPFALTLGYVWVDTFQPQQVAYVLLNSMPVAMIMGGGAMFIYMAIDRRSPPAFNLAWALQIFMAVWVTLTLAWAEAPVNAWGKWDWAFKTILFSAFIPLSIRSRVQIEAFAQVYVWALAANVIPFGVKTLLSGGGYGVNLGLVAGNSGLAEGGLLSTLCLMMVPLTMFLARHGQLMPRSRFVPLAYLGLASLSIVTALGTFERSALIGLVMLGAYWFLRSPHKLRVGLVLLAAGVIGSYLTSDRWAARISTIQDYNEESSALVRLLVWRWTLDYSFGHPFGGGFDSYRINHIQLPSGLEEFGRAFHSIYFEMLGEQGWVGLLVWLLLSGETIFGLYRLSKRVRRTPNLAWCGHLSDALQTSLVVFHSAGAFVGIAFQPMYWYTIALSVCLRQYVYRVERVQLARPETSRWRAAGSILDRPPEWRPDPGRNAGGMRPGISRPSGIAGRAGIAGPELPGR